MGTPPAASSPQIDLLQVATITRGLTEEEGGYHWSGELRLWDTPDATEWQRSSRW
jgi:hypothetical protein